MLAMVQYLLFAFWHDFQLHRSAPECLCLPTGQQNALPKITQFDWPITLKTFLSDCSIAHCGAMPSQNIDHIYDRMLTAFLQSKPTSNRYLSPPNLLDGMAQGLETVEGAT